jgi:hypothetical protein
MPDTAGHTLPIQIFFQIKSGQVRFSPAPTETGLSYKDCNKLDMIALMELVGWLINPDSERFALLLAGDDRRESHFARKFIRGRLP